MQPAKKNLTKVMSAISMAAAATLAAKSAYAAITITPYYGSSSSASAPFGQTNPNGVFIATNESGSGATLESVNSSGSPTTLTMAVGDYLFLACDVVVTGNTNAAAGKKTGNATNKDIAQPSYLGLSSLGIQVVSSDSSATMLQPYPTGTPDGSWIESSASINDANGSGWGDNSGFTTKNNSAGGAVPVWTGEGYKGDAETGQGSVGLNDPMGGGNVFVSTMATTANTPALVSFASPNNTTSYANATEDFDSLALGAVGKGVVSLTPQIVQADTSYWSNTTVGTSTSQSVYGAPHTTQSMIQPLAVLVIDITQAAPSAQAILSLSLSTDVAPTTYGSNEGTLHVTGAHSNYLPGEIQVTPAATSYLTITGFNPETDEELYAFDVLVNGTEATTSQINVLINAIDGDGIAPASAGVAAIAGTWAGLELAGPNPFPAGSSSPWNLYVDMGNAVDIGSGTATYLGWDVSNQDSNLVGYTIEQVGVVPEPMSLGLLAVGGVGLMARRSRRKI